MKKKKERQALTGTLSKHKKGFGFVPVPGEDRDFYISAGNMNGAMNGDLVEVIPDPASPREDSREGRIIRVLKRNLTEVVGTFERRNEFGFVEPEGKRPQEDVLIRKKNFRDAQRGDKVVAKITRYPDRDNGPEGKITEIISRRGEAGGDIRALIRESHLCETFPEGVTAEAGTTAGAGVTEEDLKGRRDLRQKTIITIDGPDAKDFDDAVSVEILPAGHYLLGVHIADVTHYVGENGAMDREALKRGNSVYLIDQVIPMLPETLSNGICSLNPDTDRLTVSVEMEVDACGEVVAHEIYESVIHSKARLVYTDVSDLLENHDVDFIRSHRDIFEDLLIMGRLAELLGRKREARGSLEFDLDEASITLDRAGIPVRVEAAERRAANRLIEEFMLLANETVAKQFHQAGTPFVYRNHEAPSQEKMDEFRTFIQGFGLRFPGPVDSVSPGLLNEILGQAAGKPYEAVVNTVLLRSMQKACYGVDCRGHFGLCLEDYCHFTSPIRRYADLLVHRIIKASLRGELDREALRNFKAKTLEAAEAASDAERQAINLERDVEQMKKAEYMSAHIGLCCDGIISGVTRYGIYVSLANTVEGMIRVDSLTDDYYVFEPEQYRLIGRRTHKVFRLGEPMAVIVDSVHVEDREINFVINESTGGRYEK